MLHFFTNYFNKNYKFINLSILSILSLFSISFLFKYYCNYITFNRLDKLFPKKLKWEKDLQIYSIAMPIFHINTSKKQKCILFISGYRDIPFIWNEIIYYFKNDNKIDFFAPRTFGNGRSFFQDHEPNDWTITYLEAIYILQELYEEIDIISYSTGCVIALYLSQFTYKCKINNIILCAPFLLKNENILDYLLFNSIFSKILNPLLNFLMPYRLKFPEKGYKYIRDTHYEILGKTDYYELAGFFKLDTKLIKFKNTRPTNINANNITILHPNNDVVIGNIQKQKHIIEDIFKKNINIINIPSNEYNMELINFCGHSMFKENPYIIYDIYKIIKNIISK